MKFSPDVNHKSVVNWWKNFGRSMTDMSAMSLFASKLCEGLAPILFEILSKKNFWWGSSGHFLVIMMWKESNSQSQFTLKGSLPSCDLDFYIKKHTIFSAWKSFSVISVQQDTQFLSLIGAFILSLSNSIITLCLIRSLSGETSLWE